ncbi:MAG: hypothetical protein WKF89_11420, partial [Chitinophagaceae bacterium]
MHKKLVIVLFYVMVILVQVTTLAQKQASFKQLDVYGDSLQFEMDSSFLINFPPIISEGSVKYFYEKLNQSHYHSVINALTTFKEQHHPDDWLFYQLVRKVVQQVSPKAENYYRYTLYKLFILAKCGYEVMLSTSGNYLLFYVQSDENIYNIPSRMKDGKQFVCLNFHDYKNIDFQNNKFTEIPLNISKSSKGFSYKVTRLPDFKSSDYIEKEIQFNYYQNKYHFKVKLNPEIQLLFTNYPVVDYSTYLNIPLSNETYKSLIPVLKKGLKGLSEKNGMDYLMRFTRNAFSYIPDSKNFGGEKRLTAEQTLYYNQSDCEDRVGLFFYLVKEIYNVPMIVLTY